MLTAVFCCLSRTTRFVRPAVVCRSPVFHGRKVSRSARCLEQTVTRSARCLEQNVSRSARCLEQNATRSARCLEQNVSKNQCFGPSSDRSRRRPNLFSIRSLSGADRLSKNQCFGPSSDRSRRRPILSGLTPSSAGSRLLLHRIEHR